jgi:hypothetical protein
MGVKLTPRMQSWLTNLGAHVAVVRKGEAPTIIVAESCRCDGEHVSVPLSDAQRRQISDIVRENDWVAIAPGGLGAVRAPYQFKGRGRIEGDHLTVSVEQIYCTKPGWEAGRRLDVMSWDDMCQFDSSRWKDVDPPGVE